MHGGRRVERHVERADRPLVVPFDGQRDAHAAALLPLLLEVDVRDAEGARAAARGGSHRREEDVRVLVVARKHQLAQHLGLGTIRLDVDGVLEVDVVARDLGIEALRLELRREAEHVDLHAHRAVRLLLLHLLAQHHTVHAQHEVDRALGPGAARLARRVAAVNALDCHGRRVGVGADGLEVDRLRLRHVAQLHRDDERASRLELQILQRQVVLHDGVGQKRGERHRRLPEHAVGLLLVLVEDGESQRRLLEVLAELAVQVDGETE